jgi:hypothetical protein
MTNSPLCLWLYEVQDTLTWGDFGYLLRVAPPLLVVGMLIWWAFRRRRLGYEVVEWSDLRLPLALLIPALLAQLARVVWFVGCYTP